MVNVLILYYSTYGHIENLAKGIAEGVKSLDGVSGTLRRVPELMDESVAAKKGVKTNQSAPYATVEELPNYDAIILGSPTRYGRIAAPLAHFLDQTGGLWYKDALVGKVGSVFTSTASQHGGQETTLMSLIVNLMHFGMTIVSNPYTEKRLSDISEVSGGTPYGSSTTVGPDGSRLLSENELRIAYSHGSHVAKVALALKKDPLKTSMLPE